MERLGEQAQPSHALCRHRHRGRTVPEPDSEHKPFAEQGAVILGFDQVSWNPELHCAVSRLRCEDEAERPLEAVADQVGDAPEERDDLGVGHISASGSKVAMPRVAQAAVIAASWLTRVTP